MPIHIWVVGLAGLLRFCDVAGLLPEDADNAPVAVPIRERPRSKEGGKHASIKAILPMNEPLLLEWNDNEEKSKHVLKVRWNNNGEIEGAISVASAITGVPQVQVAMKLVRVSREDLRGFPDLVQKWVKFHHLSQPPNVFAKVVKDRKDYLAFVQELCDRGVAQVLAEPRLTVIEGKPATFFARKSQPWANEPNLEYNHLNIQIKVIPSLVKDGQISLDVEKAVGTMDCLSLSGWRIQRMATLELVKDGQTLAIGGITCHEVRAHTTKTPILGDLPLLGPVFFSDRVFTVIEDEFLLLVSAHAVDGKKVDRAKERTRSSR